MVAHWTGYDNMIDVPDGYLIYAKKDGKMVACHVSLSEIAASRDTLAQTCRLMMDRLDGILATEDEADARPGLEADSGEHSPAP